MCVVLTQVHRRIAKALEVSITLLIFHCLNDTTNYATMPASNQRFRVYQSERKNRQKGCVCHALWLDAHDTRELKALDGVGI